MQSSKKKRLKLLLVILVICIGFDQLTKWIAVSQLKSAGRISFIADTMRLEYAENPGAFLGLGGNWSAQTRFYFFILFNMAILVYLLWYMAKNWQMDTSQFVCFSFILAGGLGNQLDRCCNNGLVIDFLNIGIGSLRTGIFNIADIAITFGILILIGLIIKQPKS